jgi:hypothetical protein
LHLLLDLLLLRHSGGSDHGLVFLEVVDKLPLFVLGVVVDYVNPLAFGRAGDARDAASVSGGETAGGGGWLARVGQQLLNHVPGAALSVSAAGRSSRHGGLRSKLPWILLLERKGLAWDGRRTRRRVRGDWLSAKLRLLYWKLRLLPGNLRLL